MTVKITSLCLGWAPQTILSNYFVIIATRLKTQGQISKKWCVENYFSNNTCKFSALEVTPHLTPDLTLFGNTMTNA